jgi:hypothetical protein
MPNWITSELPTARVPPVSNATHESEELPVTLSFFFFLDRTLLAPHPDASDMIPGSKGLFD